VSRIVVVGASQGGIQALHSLIGALPETFEAPIFIVQHIGASKSMLPSILNEADGNRAAFGTQGEKVREGRIYVAPPDHHLLVDGRGELTLTHTELVHFVRPSADLLFESAAASFRDRALAVVLSGSGSDGAMGVNAVKKMGGTVIVQDRAEFAGMPDAARRTGAADFVLPLAEIGPALQKLVTAS